MLWLVPARNDLLAIRQLNELFNILNVHGHGDRHRHGHEHGHWQGHGQGYDSRLLTNFPIISASMLIVTIIYLVSIGLPLK